MEEKEYLSKLVDDTQKEIDLISIELEKFSKSDKFITYVEKNGFSEYLGQGISDDLCDLSDETKQDIDRGKSESEQEIPILKRQLKHCKSYVERQNIERRINELHRKERNEIHIKQYGSANILKYNIN